jgi:hypothetical protein
MQVGQGPNVGCSAKGKKNIPSTIRVEEYAKQYASMKAAAITVLRAARR